jgi:hypothetical protein
MFEQREHGRGQRRQEPLDVGRATVHDPFEVDARGEAAAGAGEHHRRVAGPGQRVGQRGEQLQVQRVDRPVVQREDGDVAVHGRVDHPPSLARVRPSSLCTTDGGT